MAGTGLVVFLWIIDYLSGAWCLVAGRRWPSVVLAVLVANPGAYQTLSFDFHIEPISTVFVLLAGRDLWSGRHRRIWIWIAIALTCGSFAAITLVGLGHLGPTGRQATRRQGARVIGAAWLAGTDLAPRRQRRIGTRLLRLPGRRADRCPAPPASPSSSPGWRVLHPSRAIDTSMSASGTFACLSNRPV